MTFPRPLVFPLLLAPLPGCAAMEPIHGCTLAAVNEREVLRARTYLHPAIPARILVIGYPGRSLGHAVLIYRLDPEGWFAYSDTFGSRQLEIHVASEFPDPMIAAHAAFPGSNIAVARWYEPPR